MSMSLCCAFTASFPRELPRRESSPNFSTALASIEIRRESDLASDAALAQEFVRFVLSEAGQRSLKEHGYAAP